jgi:threonine synthase
MLTHLSCFLCGKEYAANQVQGLCECGRPLKVNYDLSAATLLREALADREPTLWRYREVLPDCEPVSLGEGLTPLLPTPKLGDRWYVKDEGVNPTASFKARGMALAVSMAKKFGLNKLAVPSAGNAGGALAAYAARAGLEAHIFMPKDTPQACIIECQMHGANVTLWDGLINDCAAEIGRRKEAEGWFDLSTLKEPYRIEGKKTMGYEVAEQMDWRLPDVIVYPTGGGTGLIGMWKAFDEMERMGWIGPERPKMISVQAEGCAVLAGPFERGERFAELVPNAHTVASGLRVPKAVGDFIMLDLIRESSGTAMTVTDSEMVAGAKEMARKAGIYGSPEGGATLGAAQKLREQGVIQPNEVVLLMNTGSGVKYAEALAEAESA